MKKIFYICKNAMENSDFPPALMGEDPVTNDISVLFLKKEQDFKNAKISQVWNLSKNKTENEGENNFENISYQEFLENVFSHDLALVI